jgi:serine/threonine protein kinase/tetratricopeptide (TPR) repeat protein/TolB-like protein
MGQNEQPTELAVSDLPPFASSATDATAVQTSRAGLSPGDIVADRYKILACLGQGGMGTVYKALDCELDRIIVLKTIRPDLTSNTNVVRRFKQEILLARQISHRNVIRIFDFGVALGLRFITMEFFDGEDLKTRLARSGKFPPSEAVAIMRQICEGLQAAHAEDVIHRDLKPQNILIDAQNQIRIMDFGLARSLEAPNLTRTGVVIGTPDYMAPEQARGDAADVRSDIFSAGLVFYELLTGDLPFKGDSSAAKLLSRTHGRARSPHAVDPSVPKRLSQVVMRCLEPNPARRYQSAEEILDDLSGRDLSRPSSSRVVTGLLKPGMMLGARYRIEAEAGEGGMGKVYRATDLDLNRTVALKVVRPELAGDPDHFERLKREILLASRVTHRHVLRIHDLGEADEVHFISMAWVDGQDLDAFIRHHGPLPEDQILRLTRQICEGLEAAHREGVIHRDLKPRNVLLDSAGNACISDFGLAEILDLPHTPGPTDQISGTPRYMSPEQVQGKPADQRTDIYSLGLVLYEMATGEIPFKDDSVFQAMLQRIIETPKSPKLLNPAISDKLTAVILRCLERDPERRYNSAQELVEDLPRPGKLTSGKNLFGRFTARVWIYAAAGTVLLGIAGAVFFHAYHRGVQRPTNGTYVAVLPFWAIGSDSKLEYYAEGISEAISSRLSSARRVHPTSPAALEKVDLSQPAESVAKKVGANLVVRGTVQNQGDQIEVVANIYNVESHKPVWSKSFVDTRQNLLPLQDEVANQLVRELGGNDEAEARVASAQPPTQNLDAYDLYLRGRDILKHRQSEKDAQAALELFKQACAKDPGFALAWTGVADASLEMFRLNRDSFRVEEALATAREATRRDSRLPEVHFALGSVYTQTGNNAEAVAEIKRALKLEPNSDDGYLRLGHAYEGLGQNEAALSAFKKAVELNPYYWYNHDQLGKAYYRMGRNEDALKEFKRVAELDPANESVHNAMGIVYSRLSRWEECIQEFQKAIELHPSANAYNSLGTAYFYAGRYAEAIPMFEKAINMDPHKAVFIGNLADAYRNLNQGEKARATYDRAIQVAYQQLQVNPRDASSLGNVALYEAKEGQILEAEEAIRRARSMNGSNNQLMYDEAVVEALAGHNRDALRALQRSLQNGFSAEEARKDPELARLRRLPGFDSMMKNFKSARAPTVAPVRPPNQHQPEQKQQP